MKYKVGDKFLQEIEVIRIDEENLCPYMVLPDGGRWSEAALYELRRPDDMTAEEAWEIAKKIIRPRTIGGFSADDAENIFGTAAVFDIMSRFTPQQAKSKIETWEAEKEIKVGDVVRADSTKAVVLNIHDEYFDVLVEDGCAEEWYKNKVTKTDRHIDIQGLLEQIGGGE